MIPGSSRGLPGISQTVIYEEVVIIFGFVQTASATAAKMVASSGTSKKAASKAASLLSSPLSLLSQEEASVETWLRDFLVYGKYVFLAGEEEEAVSEDERDRMRGSKPKAVVTVRTRLETTNWWLLCGRSRSRSSRGSSSSPRSQR